MNLPCPSATDEHSFHYECLDKWINSRLLRGKRFTCPICRNQYDYSREEVNDDAIEISDHLTKDFDTWLSSGANLPSINVTGIGNKQEYESAADIVISGTANDSAGEKLGSIGGIQKLNCSRECM